ncbi:hypothetical protein TREMEDRAFT_33448 [Tremella mesenterica DSM 1558]|uniref:uncharacterized protein n=1 Tax=Tremella mesenterica (strain ATCC 24925 / CBS 8224 / DSM 1558 / NBRC 9311 / NRRL Y-6157 / RJB 2259-6 / UBC 559-6) TaxID=578456 RepID=UPI0003F48D39|nr:uncharacterized protein TREMEDRAFT_33448 [Tremella mesenterica DSM 1558]EIW67609.1 hypothetical protein TREMEDRAFT_33448 [Tremella mesenterica DSM 1558]
MSSYSPKTTLTSPTSPQFPSRPLPKRGISTPPRRYSPLPTSSAEECLSPTNAFFSPGASALDLHARNNIHRKRAKKGMTFAEVHQTGIISSEEKSRLFDKIDLDEKSIKRLPKKSRPYYEHLAKLKDHYLEVDSLLSGELPTSIAKSFLPTTKSYTRQVGDLEEEVRGNYFPAWLRRGSSWRANRERRERGIADDEEEGEREVLLPSERDERRERTARVALNVNTIINALLVAAKTVAVLYSSSISLTASLVDSALDLLSTFIILGTSWAIGLQTDKHLYPAGKRRFEPLGVLIFSVAMIASFVQVFIESFQRVIGPQGKSPVELSAIGIATMLATIGIKAVIWVWCSRIPSSGVQALAQDAENDVWFNIMSLAFPFIGTKIHWRLLDPIGGMVLSTYIIFEWVKTLLQNFANLSGRTASRDHLTRVIYLVTRFNPVLEIADVECYHIGDDLIVEIDVILPHSSTLHFAHDVGETIQCVLESLEGIIRGYVQGV